MKINLISRNGVLYVDYRQNAKRIRRSLKFSDTKANRAYVFRNIIPQIERKIMQNISTTEDISLKGFFDRILQNIEKYNTRHNYIRSIKAIFRYLPNKDITEYCVADIDEAISKMLKDGLKVTTIKSYIAPLNLAFKMAYRSELISKNPLILPKFKKQEKKEIIPYNANQIENLINNAKDELKIFLYFAFYTGARSGEILALTWKDIKQTYISINKTISTDAKVIGPPKTGEKRDVFILDNLKEFLSRLDHNGERIFSKNYQRILYEFRGLCKTLGYQVQGLHSTRHTFISFCVSKGIDLSLIRKMVGHRDLTMIMKIYTHYIDDTDKLFALNKAFDIK